MGASGLADYEERDRANRQRELLMSQEPPPNSDSRLLWTAGARLLLAVRTSGSPALPGCAAKLLRSHQKLFAYWRQESDSKPMAQRNALNYCTRHNRCFQCV